MPIMPTNLVAITLTMVVNFAEFTWKNVPNMAELLGSSTLQAVGNMQLPNKEQFGKNPTALSVVRNAGKVPLELYHATYHTPFGKTKYTHDSFSLWAVGSKFGTQLGFIYFYSTNDQTPDNLAMLKEYLQHYHNTTIPSAMEKAFLKYNSVSEKAGRLSNFFADPLGRLLEGLEKLFQDQFINKGLPIVYLSFWEVPAYALRNGFGQLPYAIVYSLVKSAMIDAIGDVFVIVFDFSKKQLQDIYNANFNINTGLSPTAIMPPFNTTNITVATNSSVTTNDSVDSFFTTAYEAVIPYCTTVGVAMLPYFIEIAYNILATVFMATPNKMAGNALHILDIHHPRVLVGLGVPLALSYMYWQFGQQGTDNFLNSMEAAKKLKTQQDRCYAGYLSDYQYDITEMLKQLQKNQVTTMQTALSPANVVEIANPLTKELFNCLAAADHN